MSKTDSLKTGGMGAELEEQMKEVFAKKMNETFDQRFYKTLEKNVVEVCAETMNETFKRRLDKALEEKNMNEIIEGKITEVFEEKVKKVIEEKIDELFEKKMSEMVEKKVNEALERMNISTHKEKESSMSSRSSNTRSRRVHFE